MPEQLENEETQEAYWELQKFLVMALKANPNVLECLYSPLVETATPLAKELLAIIRHFADVIANVYRRPEMYVGSEAEPHAMDCLLWTMHRTWADAADRTFLFTEALESVLEAEQCGGKNFHRRFCERHPSGSAKEAMDYVLACWQRVSASLGICEPGTTR